MLATATVPEAKNSKVPAYLVQISINITTSEPLRKLVLCSGATDEVS